MMYFSGTIADVIEDGATATLILDTGRIKHQLHADSHLLAEALTALYGDDCIGNSHRSPVRWFDAHQHPRFPARLNYVI